MHAATVNSPSLCDNTAAYMEWTPERIRALRKQLRLNQTEMAERLGYNRTSSISDLELGKFEPSPAVCILLDILEEHGRIPLNREEGEAP